MISPDTIESRIAEGKLQEAEQMADAFLAAEPAQAVVWRLKGQIHNAQGDKLKAIGCFNQSLKCRPDFADACFDLAHTLEEIGQIAPAIQTYAYLSQIAPHHPGVARLAPLRSGTATAEKIAATFLQGNAWLQQCQYEKAEACYREICAIKVDIPDVLANLGLALTMMRRFSEAEQVLGECVRLNPAHAEALNTLGTCYKDMGQATKAIASFRQAVKLKPDYFNSWVNLGKQLQETGEDAQAIEMYEKALKIDPEHGEVLAELTQRLYFLCRWEKVESLRQRLEDAIVHNGQCALPFIVALFTTPQTQLLNARRWAATRYGSGLPYDPARPLPATARKDGKLRIGYLSADFCKHATASLISEMFEHHDRDRFTIFAYSCGADDESAERARVVKSVDHFRDIAAMDEKSADHLIRQDGIDILVDLKGYTMGHRMGLMAMRPAPLQMHYLGYPGTTGAPFIDYFIADPISAPVDADFSERLIRLPHSYQINDRSRPLPKEAGTRQSYGLPESGFVFCGFNQTYKITPAIFDVWMRLLATVEGSVLWLFATNAEATDNLKREAKQRGIDPSRLLFAEPAPLAEHLARYAHADLFLDTSPVCGHTTASDALWCGVPVVTMAGESFASRVAASLLGAVNLPELVTKNLEEYETLALALARDAKKLQALKEHLEKGRMECPLFDSVATTHAIEAEYLQAAKRHGF